MANTKCNKIQPKQTFFLAVRLCVTGECVRASVVVSTTMNMVTKTTTYEQQQQQMKSSANVILTYTQSKK